MSVRTSPASAMLAAMLVAGLLASAATLMLIETKAARAASSDAYRFARAEAAVSSLLSLAEVRLDSGDPLPAQGVLFEDSTGRVSRQDAAGLVDLNAATPDRMAALFASLGASSDEAAALADAIADWRDADGLRRLHGAEAEDYRRAGLEGPANRPFVTETEIARVLGMRADLVSCALPYLTVYSGADIDANAASDDLRQRLSLSGTPNAAGAALGTVIILRAEAPISAHAVFQRSLWLRLTGDPTRPFMIHRAEQGFAPTATPASHCVGANP